MTELQQTEHTTIHHATESIAVTLCRATNTWPELSSAYKEFMSEKLLPAFDNLTELQFNQVPEEASKWANGAIEATLNGNPIGDCPGWDEVFEVEDKTPMFPPEEYEQVTSTEPNPEPDGTDGQVETTDQKPAKKERKRVARGAKATKEAKTTTGGGRGSRPLSDGKTTRIMQEVYNHPKISVDEIIANLAQEGLSCTIPSTTVVRSFFRHSVKYLDSVGALKRPIEF